MCTCMYRHVLNSFVQKPRSTVIGSYSESIFSFLRNYQTIFQSGYPILHAYRQCMRFPVASRPHQHLVLSVFWILASLLDSNRCIMVSFCFNLLLPDSVPHGASFHYAYLPSVYLREFVHTLKTILLLYKQLYFMSTNPVCEVFECLFLLPSQYLISLGINL